MEEIRGIMSALNRPSSSGNNPWDIVLANVFERCELSDLFRFRLVSKRWHQLSLARFRNDATVIVHERPLEEQMFPNLPPNSHLKWKLMRNELDVGGDKPFRTFRICDMEFIASPPPSTPPELSTYRRDMEEDDENFPQMYKNMDRFFAKYGEWMWKLELVACSIHSVEAFKKAIFEDTPNLKELKLQGCIRLDSREEDDGGGEGEVVQVQPNLTTLSVTLSLQFPITWRLFFLHFPNINKLEIQSFRGKVSTPGITWRELAPLVDTLEALSRNKECKLCIKKLRLEGMSPEDGNAVKRLLQLPILKLSKLDLDLADCEDEAMSILPSALRLHANTLDDLDVGNAFVVETFNADNVRSYNNFPFQDYPFLLTHLKLEGLICPNLYFLEKFPNLRRLSVFQYKKERMLRRTDFRRMENVRLPRLKELQFHVEETSNFFLSAESMEMLVKVMPNMESFEGQLLNPSFRVVCRGWKQLTNLDINAACVELAYEGRLETINDQGITGVVPGSEDRLPNITDLKYLRKLKMLVTGRVSDISVNEGFLRLPHLSTLVVALSQGTSDEAFNAIARHVPGCSVSIDDLLPNVYMASRAMP